MWQMKWWRSCLVTIDSRRDVVTKRRHRCELSGCQAPAVGVFPNLPKKTETWATTINFKTIDSEAGVGVFCFPPAETREQSERQFALKAAVDHRKLPAECFIPAALFVSCNSDELSTRHRKHCKPLHLMFLFLAVRLSKQQPADNKN